MEQKSAGEKKKNIFLEFLEKDELLGDFLQIGMTSSEIANHFCSTNNGNKAEFMQSMRSYVTMKEKKISMRNPDFLAREIGGRRMGLKKPHQSTKVNLRLRSYDYGNIYFSNNASPYTRIICEAGDSSSASNNIRVIGAICNLQSAGIRESLSHGMNYSNHKEIISRLEKGGFIVKDEKQKTYMLGSKIKLSYSRETKRIWEEFKIWPLREKFYP